MYGTANMRKLREEEERMWIAQVSQKAEYQQRVQDPIPTHEDIPALLAKIAGDISYVAKTVKKWDKMKDEEEKETLKGRLFTSIFRVLSTTQPIHIDLLDEQYDRNIPAGAVINRPYARARTISIVNINPVGLTSTIRIQTNSKSTDARATTDLKSADGIELDGRDHRGRPKLQSIDIEITEGSFADVRMVIYA